MEVELIPNITVVGALFLFLTAAVPDLGSLVLNIRLRLSVVDFSHRLIKYTVYHCDASSTVGYLGTRSA